MKRIGFEYQSEEVSDQILDNQITNIDTNVSKEVDTRIELATQGIEATQLKLKELQEELDFLNALKGELNKKA